MEKEVVKPPKVLSMILFIHFLFTPFIKWEIIKFLWHSLILKKKQQRFSSYSRNLKHSLHGQHTYYILHCHMVHISELINKIYTYFLHN